MFSFGVVIFFDVGQAGREGELLRLRRAPSGMRDAQVISEEFTVRELEDARGAARPDVEEGVLVVDRLTPERASMVALTMAQSAAMEYYEGIVDLMFSDSPACTPLVQAGKLHAVMVTGPEPLSNLKGTPSASQAGLAGLDIGSWGMLLAPRGTPDPVVDKLNALMNEVMKKPAVRRYFATTSAEGYAGSRADADKYIQSEMVKWGGIIKKANIQPE